MSKTTETMAVTQRVPLPDEIRKPEPVVHHDPIPGKIEEGLLLLDRMDDYDLGKMASDPAWTMFGDDVKGFYDPLPVLGSRVRKTIHSEEGHSLAASILKKTDSPPPHAISMAISLIGLQMFMEWLDA